MRWPPCSTPLRQKQRNHPDAEKPFTMNEERLDSRLVLFVAGLSTYLVLG
jgi:hypothetical protein